MPKIRDVLFGTKDKNKQLSLQTPLQQKLEKLIQQGLTKGEGPLKDIFGEFDEEAFEKGVANPSMKHFQEKILPGILEKFSSGNRTLGSGFRDKALQAGTDLESKLAELLYGAKQNQTQNRLAGVNQALGIKGFENLYKKGEEGALAGFTKSFANSLGSTLGGGGVGASGNAPAAGGVSAGGNAPRTIVG